MTWLLDTNIVSETSKLEPNANCVAWLRARRGQCQLSAITVAELRYGIERMPGGKRKSAAEREFQFLCEDYAGRLLDFLPRARPGPPCQVQWG